MSDEFQHLRSLLHEYQDADRARLEGLKAEATERRKRNSRASLRWGITAIIYFLLSVGLKEGYIEAEWGVVIVFISAVGAMFMSGMAKDMV